METRDSLIKVPAEMVGSENNLPTELSEIQSKRYSEALTNLITGKTPKDAIFQRPVRKGVDVDYVPGWWFISQLNALFGYYWDFEIEDQGIGEGNCWVRGKLTIKDPKTGLTVTKSSFGGSRLKSKENPAIDIGDDLKSAATDALKKAATLLGIASDIYGRRETQDQTKSKSQLEGLYKVGESKGLDKDAVIDISEKTFGKAPDELTEIDVLGLIREVRSRPIPTE